MSRKRPTKTAKRIESLLRQVRRMENRGYRFDGDIRQVIKNLSPQKARFFTAETLYRNATWLDEETGKILSGVQGRQAERKRTAEKAAETRKRRKEEAQFVDITPPVEPAKQEVEEPYDITQEIIKNFEPLVEFFNRAIPAYGVTKQGKEVEKTGDLIRYAESQQNYLQVIFEQEKAKDLGALARRIYESSQDIDSYIGTIEYSLYKEDLRVAGNNIIKIIRGTDHLSKEDRQASEDLANEEWEEY